jgi:hypothetical protein
LVTATSPRRPEESRGASSNETEIAFECSQLLAHNAKPCQGFVVKVSDFWNYRQIQTCHSVTGKRLHKAPRFWAALSVFQKKGSILLPCDIESLFMPYVRKHFLQ